MPWTQEHRIAWRKNNPQWKPKRNPVLSKKYYERHKAKTTAQNWVRQIGELGCTPERYAELLEGQKGVCAICGRANVSGKKLAVDHHHESGVVRGLLCNPCNLGLGTFQDDPELLNKAARYLCHTRP